MILKENSIYQNKQVITKNYQTKLTLKMEVYDFYYKNKSCN